MTDEGNGASIVHGEALRRRAAEHRARWEAQKRADEARRSREREDEAIARALRAAREVASAGGEASGASAPASGLSTPREEPDEDRQCRICFSGEETGRLFSPCMCRGSMGLVHVECLNHWRNMSRNPRSYYGCDQCGYQYNLERTRAAAFLERQEPATVLAVVGILLLTLATALSCRFASHGAFWTAKRVQSFLQKRGALNTRPGFRRQLAALAMESVETHRGVVLHASPLYVEVLFYGLVDWIPPWRNLRRTDTWFHNPRIVGLHEKLDLLTGGFLIVALVAFCMSMFNKYRLLGARRMAEYIGPSFAIVFFAHGSRGLRLVLFAGSLYAYARLHDRARLKCRELLMRIGQRVLEVQSNS